MIPVGEDIVSFGLDEDVHWVLIVEKEVKARIQAVYALGLSTHSQAVFQTLCHLKITDHQDMPGRGLLITVSITFPRLQWRILSKVIGKGKGYPDIATRHLVKTLADCLPLRYSEFLRFPYCAELMLYKGYL